MGTEEWFNVQYEEEDILTLNLLEDVDLRDLEVVSQLLSSYVIYCTKYFLLLFFTFGIICCLLKLCKKIERI